MVLIPLVACFTFVCKGCRAFEFDTLMQLTCIKIRGSRDFDGYPEEQVGRSWHRCVSPGIYANLSWIRHYLDVNGIYLALLASNLPYVRFVISSFAFKKMHFPSSECYMWIAFYANIRVYVWKILWMEKFLPKFQGNSIISLLSDNSATSRISRLEPLCQFQSPLCPYNCRKYDNSRS